jgi:2-methylcitrate dehydratase PrpD
VAKIEITPHRRRLPHTDNPSPQTTLQAKFSVQYAVARALLDSAVRIADLEGDAHFDTRIRPLLARTTAFAHPDMADDAEAQFSAEVRVTLNDGRVLSRRVDDMTGRGGDHPTSSEELWEKLDDCARRALPKEDIMPLFERLETLERPPTSGAVTRLLAKRPPSGAVSAAAKPSAAQGKANTLMETSWVP